MASLDVAGTEENEGGIQRLLAGAAGITATLVLLVWGYFVLVGPGPPFRISGAATMALLVGSVSAVIWFGFVWGWGRLLITSLACVVVAYGGWRCWH